MDSVYIRDGILIDIVDKDWMLDKIPYPDIIGIKREERT